MVEDQEFCLQIDAHSTFENDWDLIALSSWFSTGSWTWCRIRFSFFYELLAPNLGNEMAVLTTYPNAYGQMHDQHFAPVRCSTVFVGSGLTAIEGGTS